MTQQATHKVGDIIGMSEVTEMNGDRVWGLKYIGPTYIVRRPDGKYLHHIHRDANSGTEINDWSTEKWAMKFRPIKAGRAVGDYAIETIQAIFDDIEVIEV